MMEFIKQPWHWSVAGIIIGLTVPLLLLLGNKKFGVSTSLRDICAICFPANIPLFKYDWRPRLWNVFFAAGIIIGAFLAVTFFENTDAMAISKKTKEILTGYGIHEFQGLMPIDVFSWGALFTIKGLVFFVFGGFLVGFGTRYAGGCTSGHSIMGLSNLQWPSLVATFAFMLGGFVCTNFILPIIFKLL